MTTLVATPAFNRPDFLLVQHQMFEHLMEDDYEFVVINDAKTRRARQEIRRACASRGIRCLDVPQHIHGLPYLPRSPGDNLQNPNVRHCNSVQWAWNEHLSKHGGPVLVLDNDMFPIRPLSIDQLLGDNHLAGVYWSTQDMVTGEPRDYLWLALLVLNNPLLEDKEICFNCGYLPNSSAVCDSGGWTNLYLQRHRGQLRVKSLAYRQGHEFFCPYRHAPESLQTHDTRTSEEVRETLQAAGFTRAEVDLVLLQPDTIELLADNRFLHYRGGTNYENHSMQFVARKDAILNDFLERVRRETPSRRDRQFPSCRLGERRGQGWTTILARP